MRVAETGAEIIRDELPEVWGDSTLLTQLYQNLIGNALKFSGDQPPVIRLTAEEQDGFPVFGIKDNGIGIELKYAQQIFQPFRRLHSRTEYEGSGIGLAICHKIVERHGGKIWVESEPGKGAHFRFTISHRRRE
jgi:light-regulated signal transduction histidine kinase (bacteriophytochrome)